MTIRKKITRSIGITFLALLCSSNVWAVPYEIEIQYGVASPPFPFAIYSPLEGTLTGDLTLGGGGYQLSGIMGDLIDSDGVNYGAIVRILDGLITDGAGVYAHGSFEYEIIGGSLDGTSGIFTFDPSQSSNFLNSSALQLWGGDYTNNIGLDLRAELSPGGAIPEPGTILLLVTGVVGIIIWRLSRRGVGIA